MASGEQIEVLIIDNKHPHYGESGVLTGITMNSFGKLQAEVKLTDCAHGMESCFVRAAQVDRKRSIFAMMQ